MNASPVEVFWRQGCPFCLKLRVGLMLRGVRATWRNVWDDPEASEFVRSHAQGNETVPTVRVGTVVLTNPSAGAVRSLARRSPGR